MAVRFRGRDAGGCDRDGRAPILKSKASSTAGFHTLADQLRAMTLAGIDAHGGKREGGFSVGGACCRETGQGREAPGYRLVAAAALRRSATSESDRLPPIG